MNVVQLKKREGEKIVRQKKFAFASLIMSAAKILAVKWRRVMELSTSVAQRDPNGDERVKRPAHIV